MIVREFLKGVWGKLLARSFPHVNRVPLLLLHLSQEHEHRRGEDDKSVGENVPEVREDARIVACNDGALHLDRVHKGQGVGDLFESTANEVEIEPNSRKPSREIGQKGSANAAHLLVVEYTSAKQSKTNIQECHGDDKQDREQNVNADIKPQNHRKKIGRHTLGKRYGNEGQGVAENKVHGCHGRCVKTVYKAALSIFCNHGSRKQGHKRKPEHGNTGREMLNDKHLYGNVRLNGTQ